MLNKELLEKLAYPVCKADVILDNNKIKCSQCTRIYPIKDGISIMSAEEIQPKR